MSKLFCATCKYYDFNTCEGVDWCRLNNEETGICGNCEREFEDLDEATEHYNAVVDEENKLYSLNCEMASKVAELEHRLSNCIEHKFDFCQDVWVIFKNQVKKTQINSFRVYADYGVEYYIKFIDGSREYLELWEDEIFATEEEAKKHLEEFDE